MWHQNGRITTSFTSYNLDKRLNMKILIHLARSINGHIDDLLLLYGNIRLAIRIVTPMPHGFVSKSCPIDKWFLRYTPGHGCSKRWIALSKHYFPADKY